MPSPTDSFKHMLGEFGAVYRGTLDNWKDYIHHAVAVKTLKGIYREL